MSTDTPAASTPRRTSPPANLPRFEYASAERIIQVGRAVDTAIVTFYGLGHTIIKRPRWDAAVSGLGWAGWQLVTVDRSGGFWFMRPVVRGRAIDDADMDTKDTEPEL